MWKPRHWREGGDPKKAALAEPVPAAAPTIDEMLQLMAKQVMEVITWTQAEGFTEAYRTAGGNARGLFQAAVIKLAARAGRSHRGRCEVIERCTSAACLVA